MSGHGGVVFRLGPVVEAHAEDLWFLPATIAIKVLPIPDIAKMPGAPPGLRGVALVDGAMIPVVDVLEDPARLTGPAMLVCSIMGENVGIVGIEIVATGRFEAADSSEMGVKIGERIARSFDVAAVIARVREGRWAV